MENLTAKQTLFVKEYLVDLNATKAAIRAGYSAANADKIGPELLGKTRVKAAIEAAMKERENRTLVTADRVVQELAKIAFSDIKDFVGFGPEEMKLGEDENGNPVKMIHAAVQIKPSEEVDGAILAEVSQTRDGLKVKPHDKMKALELLGRHMAMFTERTLTTIENKTSLEQLSEDELDRLIEEKLAQRHE